MLPAVFLAMPLNWYSVPAFRLGTSQDPYVPYTVQEAPLTGLPLFLVTAMTEIDVGVPPGVPAVTVTVTLPTPASAVSKTGTAGNWTSVIDAADSVVPSAFVALTLNV